MKGILVKPVLIKPIADDLKIETRRVIKISPEENLIFGMYHPTLIGKNGEEYPGEETLGVYTEDGLFAEKPRYLPGETVYVKEAHYAYGQWIYTEKGWRFQADDSIPLIFVNRAIPFVVLKGRGGVGWYKRSPLFLESRNARYFLTILDVSAERVQEITEEGALAEGVSRQLAAQLGLSVSPSEEEFNLTQARRTFAKLWDSINEPPYDWNSNPHVFVYQFKRIER